MRKAGPARDIPPPLELLCLKALWTLQEGNVRDVQRALAGSRSLAYTTVMTLLERLVRKGTVTRRKAGRAFLYFPQVGRDAMRRRALKEFLDIYFDGSEDDLAAFLAAAREEAGPQAAAAAAAAGGQGTGDRGRGPAGADAPAETAEPAAADPKMDAVLL